MIPTLLIASVLASTLPQDAGRATTGVAETFAQRTTRFWSWFEKNAKQFHDLFDSKAPVRAETPIVRELQRRLDVYIPDIGWNFGPGSKQGNHAFTLSPGGDRTLQLLTRYWLEQAPKIEGWDFYRFKRGHDENSKHGAPRITMSGHRFASEDFRIAVEPDKSSGRFALRVYHPHLAKLDEETRLVVIYTLLDEYVGERTVTTLVGRVDPALQAPKQAGLTLAKLREHLRKLAIAGGRNPDQNPDEMFTVYRGKPKMRPKTSPREDILTGMTCHIDLVSRADAWPGEDDFDERKVGARFVYVTLDMKAETLRQRLELRNKVQDRIKGALEKNRVATLVGAATGLTYAYVDLLAVDEAGTTTLIRELLANLEFVRSAKLGYFGGGTKPVTLKSAN